VAIPQRATPQRRPSFRVERVLVVDDSPAQRRILRSLLTRRGFEVREAGSGEEALAACRADPPDLVLSDWMMPGMSGLALCTALRALPGLPYLYFILLTSRSGKDEIAYGLEAGADDFLTKPVSAGELVARISAGERILRMERELTEKNRVIGEALAEIQALYRAFDHDLAAARKLQQSLVPERTLDYPGARFSLLLRPSGHVGGDLVGVFDSGPGRVGFFGLDVSGHGIASGILAARLSGLLSGARPGQNIALGPGGRMRPPEEVAAELNALFESETGGEHYFTLLLGEADLGTGRVRAVQAGHPHPTVLRASGAVERVGGGGLPVGLLPDARFEAFDLALAPGDRLLVSSDGITECASDSGEPLDEEGFAELLARNAALGGPALLDALLWELAARAGSAEFEDDVSALLLERLA
jgi:sigma-B regulation protein RsbU (phosphoserine phosphatase)